MLDKENAPTFHQVTILKPFIPSRWPGCRFPARGRGALSCALIASESSKTLRRAYLLQIGKDYTRFKADIESEILQRQCSHDGERTRTCSVLEPEGSELEMYGRR